MSTIAKSNQNTTVIDDNDTNVDHSFHEPEFGNLGSLERELPVELSFLMRQTAYCIAKTNNLDRQLRELKTEIRQPKNDEINSNTASGDTRTTTTNQALLGNNSNDIHSNNRNNNNVPTSPPYHLITTHSQQNLNLHQVNNPAIPCHLHHDQQQHQYQFSQDISQLNQQPNHHHHHYHQYPYKLNQSNNHSSNNHRQLINNNGVGNNITPANNNNNTNNNSNSTPMAALPVNNNHLTSSHSNNNISNNNNIGGVLAKNGDIIPSDDSGGEYSRATLSDDDELSGLLDQIAKSLRPETNLQQMQQQPMHANNSLNQQQQQSRSAMMMIPDYNPILTTSHISPRHPATIAGYTTVLNAPTHHIHPATTQYTYLTPTSSQLHHHSQQSVPVFVAMSSPIPLAPAAHQVGSIPINSAPGINSSILPGVHFQPEYRYNQYYADFNPAQISNNSHTSSSLLNQQNNHQQQQQYVSNNNNLNNSNSYNLNHGSSSSRQQFQNSKLQHHQFDSNISTLEQLVSQKEKKQIKSQLKSADNWLRMQAGNNQI